MAEVKGGVKCYGRNERRPWSEFQLPMFIALLTLHLLAIGAIIWYIWGGFWPSLTIVVTAVVMYAVTLFGVTLGYHRLFTHGGCEYKRWLKIALLVTGGMALQKDADDRVRTHWFHHSHSDRPGDPHSPYQYGGSRWLNLKGVLWAHMGWLFYGYQLPARKGTDQMAHDRDFQFQRRHYTELVIVSLALPAVIGSVAGLVSRGWYGALMQMIDGFLVAGVLRVLLLLHVTWSINSVCHLWGPQRAIEVVKRGDDGEVALRQMFPSDGSRNAWGLKALSGGEANHALHHLFPRVIAHGWDKWAVDPTKWLAFFLEKIGQVWDLQRPPEHNVLPLEVRLPKGSLIPDSEPVEPPATVAV